jgi:hypothetical protein
LRADTDTSSTSSATSSCSLNAVYNSKTTIARSRGREASAACSNVRCWSSESARGAACASGSRFTLAGPSPRNRLKWSTAANARFTDAGFQRRSPFSHRLKSRAA